MTTEYPDDVPTEWCPDCGEELAFSGLQTAGIAQLFCERCRYRHDRYVGGADVTA